MQELTIKPIGDRVIIEPLDILESDCREMRLGQIIAIGPGKDNSPMMLQIGDKVVLNKYHGTHIKYKGREIVIVGQEDILCTLSH